VDESVRYCLIAVSFLGMGPVIKKKKEILVSVIDSWITQKDALGNLIDNLGKRITVVLDFLSDVIVFALFCVMIYFGTVMSIMQMPVKGETILWIRYGYVYGTIPFGSAIAVLYFIRKWYLFFKGVSEQKENPVQKEVKDVE
jgi:TRAP-type C4-dicarboxylate transport system permease small subunit